METGGPARCSLAEALRVAAARGNSFRVHQLLQDGVPLQPDEEGFSALHYAAVNNHDHVVAMLAAYSVNLIELKDKSGRTALHHAAVRGHVDTVRTLLQIGCRVDRRCTDQLANTSLHLAAFHGYSQTVQQLIIHRAEVQLVNRDGSTALHLAAQNGHNETSRLLLFAGCQPNIKNSYGDTALHTAARYGHAGVTGILINARCKVNIQNKNGDTALHIAAAMKRKKITRLLVDSGINLNIKNKQNERAIDVATRKGHSEILELLDPKITRGGRKSIGHAKVSSAEVISPPQSAEKKKNKILLFFSRRRKQKDVNNDVLEMTASPQVQSPDVAPFGVDALDLLQAFHNHQEMRALHNHQMSIAESSRDGVPALQTSVYYIDQNHSRLDATFDASVDCDDRHPGVDQPVRVWLRHHELDDAMPPTRRHCRQQERDDVTDRLYRCQSDDTLSTVSADRRHRQCDADPSERRQKNGRRAVAAGGQRVVRAEVTAELNASNFSVDQTLIEATGKSGSNVATTTVGTAIEMEV